MINAISSGIQIPTSSRIEQSLSQEQYNVINDTLSQFTADTLTESDAINIVDAFSQANIKPSQALEQAMADLGFDAKAIGDLAGVSEQGHRPPPPKQQPEEISSMVDYLTKLLEEKLASTNSSTLSDEDKQSILTQVFEKFNIEQADSIINTTA